MFKIIEIVESCLNRQNKRLLELFITEAEGNSEMNENAFVKFL